MSGHEKPLYLSVADELKEKIISGVFPIGSLLETEERLSDRFNVSRHTIREALRVLRDEGLIKSRRGSGSKVVPPSTSHHDTYQVMSINDLLMFSEDTTFDIESIELIKIEGNRARILDIPEGEEWLRIGGLRYRKGEKLPLCWSSYFIPREFANVGRLVQRFKGPIFTLIEDFSGQKVTEVKQQISASMIPKDLIEPLLTSRNSAALMVRRTYCTDDDKILQVTLNTHPADRFQHAMTMRRGRKI